MFEPRIRAHIAVMALATISSCAQAPAPSSPRRPNVLFLAVDDLRPELGCYGDAHVRSPNIDRLARTGVTFTRAYCQQAACNQSRASLLTGLRPDTLGVWDLRTDFRDNRPDAVTLPQYFARNGYHTVAIGKIFHNTIPDPPSWTEPKLHIQGYPFDPDAVYRQSDNVVALEQRKAEIIAAGRQQRHIDRIGEWYLKLVSTEAPDVPDDAYFDGAQTTVAIEKLRELATKEQPFFFAVGYYRPHLPFNAPKKYWDLYDRAELPLPANPRMPQGAPPMAINTIRELRGYTDFRSAPIPHDGQLSEGQTRLLRHGYYASVSYVDAQIGRLLDEIERLGLGEDTIVVLWGDHGWKLGEHGSWCKMTNYETDTRVPLIVRAPGAPEAGQDCDRLVEFVDVYPTLCQLADLPVPDGLEGHGFSPLLEDRAQPWKTAAFSQFLRDGIWVAPDGVEYMGHSVRTERYRYVEWRRGDAEPFAGEPVARELYDHVTDPREDVNIVDRPESRVLAKDLAERLGAGWRQALPR